MCISFHSERTSVLLMTICEIQLCNIRSVWRPIHVDFFDFKIFAEFFFLLVKYTFWGNTCCWCTLCTFLWSLHLFAVRCQTREGRVRNLNTNSSRRSHTSWEGHPGSFAPSNNEIGVDYQPRRVLFRRPGYDSGQKGVGDNIACRAC